MWKIYYKDQIGGQNPDFWGKKFQDLDIGHTKDMCRQDYMSDIFLKYFPKEGKILDGGCGIGQHVLVYRDLGYEIEGIDFSDETIEKIIEFDHTAPCRKGNILKIEAPDSYYECYYSIGVVEHFEEGPIAAIKEAGRILRDNGVFIISVPYENLFRKIKFRILNFIGKLLGQSYISTNLGFIKKVNTYSKPDKPDSNMKFHEYISNRKEIIQTLISNGFKIEYSSPCSILWGLLEVPYMKKTYKLIHSHLEKENKSIKHMEGLDKRRRRNLLKDIIVYERRNEAFKNFFVRLFGCIFGNLFLVVCRKA